MFDTSSHTPIQQFLQYLEGVKRYSVHTLRSYGDDLNFFFQFTIREFETEDPSEITAPMVRSWMVEMKEAGMAVASLKRRISALQSFYKYRLKKGLQEHSPMDAITLPKPGRKLPVFVEEKNLDTLFRHVEFEDSWEGHTKRLALLLLYQTGMRRAELIELKREQVEFSRNALRVLGKGNKERMIPINRPLMEEIKNYWKRGDCPIALADGQTPVLLNIKGKKLAERALYEMVRGSLALVTTADKKSPHTLRHSFATHLSNQGADLNAIKELLGHSSLAATQVYTHNTIEKLKQAHQKAHPRSK